MYRVMIVDDEVAIREKISQIVRFEEYGFMVCASAKNGQEALEKLAAVQPDLILLDMRMPVLDGLGFLKELRKGAFAQMRVIILSGYSDFQYAQQAIRFGAKGYLTKPVDEEEAHERLKELAVELDAEHKQQGQEAVRHQVNRLSGLYHSTGVAEGFSNYVLLFVVVLSAQVSDEETSVHEIISACLSKTLQLATDFLFRVRGSISTYLLPKEQVGVVERTLPVQLADHKLDCVLLVDETIFMQPQEPYRHDYSEHLYTMLTTVFYGGKGVVQYQPHSREKRAEGLADEDVFLAELRERLLTESREQVLHEVDLLVAEVRAVRLEMEHIQELNYRIYYLLLEVMALVMTEHQEREPILQPPEWREYSSFLTVDRWETLQKQQIADAYDFVERCRKMSHMGVCGEVLEYVHRHFAQALSIRQVAEQFYMNPAYLGRVFQKATGVSLKQYVNDLRIAEAKRLLSQTNKMVYEIAELAGFSESKYFVAKFTKDVGKTPLEYRRQHA